MSDRFVFDATKEQIKQQFGVSSKRSDFYDSHFNISPGSLIPVIYFENGEKEIQQFRWGQIPPNADDERDGTTNHKISLKEVQKSDWQLKSLQANRCLIPAYGFYKWKTTKKKNTPFFIRLLTDDLMTIAGIYSIWESASGRKVYSCSMLTTKANPLVQPVGSHMPVILEAGEYDSWLSDKPLGKDVLKRLEEPFPMTKMAVNRVSEEVNDMDNDNSKLIQPIPK